MSGEVDTHRRSQFHAGRRQNGKKGESLKGWDERRKLPGTVGGIEGRKVRKQLRSLSLLYSGAQMLLEQRFHGRERGARGKAEREAPKGEKRSRSSMGVSLSAVQIVPHRQAARQADRLASYTCAPFMDSVNSVLGHRSQPCTSAT